MEWSGTIRKMKPLPHGAHMEPQLGPACIGAERKRDLRGGAARQEGDLLYGMFSE